jgi:putative transcriptional regulator
MEDADEETQHIPTATPEADCICLAVTDAPLRFTSWVVRLVQPVLGI